MPHAQGARQEQERPRERGEREEPLRDLDELSAIEAVGQPARVHREQQERHPVADDGESRQHRRMKRLEDDPVADDVLDVVGGGAQEHEGEVPAVVAVVERPELRARRGARGGERRSTHCGDYNPAVVLGAAGRRGAGAPPAEAPLRKEEPMKGVTLPTETVFVMEASPIKFGLGAMDEIAYDARRLGLKRVLIVTDRHIGELGLPDRVRALLEEEGIKADVYDGVEIEPPDRSM